MNQQDYFAAGFTVNNGNADIDTAAGLDVAAATKSETPTDAKAALYHQVLTHPAAGSERSQLTVPEQAQLTQKLNVSFETISTDNLEGC